MRDPGILTTLKLATEAFEDVFKSRTGLTRVSEDRICRSYERIMAVHGAVLRDPGVTASLPEHEPEADIVSYDGKDGFQKQTT